MPTSGDKGTHTVQEMIQKNGDHTQVTLCVENELGLHARPAAKLAQEAQKFDADITISAEGQEVDAKSILDILSLAAAKGCEITLTGKGNDAKEALEHLTASFQNRFDED